MIIIPSKVFIQPQNAIFAGGSMAQSNIERVTNRRQLKAFVKFPWRIYQDDPNWVPPLIFEQVDYLDPDTGPFYKNGQVALFIAHRKGQVVGTVAAFFIEQNTTDADNHEGGFGFFETIDDFGIASQLLDATCDWLREKGVSWIQGPTNFSNNERPGVLVEGADCPPVMLEAHTPLYYKTLLERYGMEKHHDLYAWRAFRHQVGDQLINVPADVLKVADAARKASDCTIRTLNMDHWDDEIQTAHYLFNATLEHLPDHVHFSESDFRRLADQFRLFIDPDLAFFAEVDGNEIGFCVAFPDINRALIHLNGRLFPFGWLKLKYYIPRIEVVSFKLMGILKEYRRRGIDALLYLEAVKAFYNKGYEWLDGSVTSESNPAVNMIAQRLGAERYKQYRIYHMKL
jgi:GNAT superfamily N-acetyltransferase